jgi:pantothenate kinase
MAAEDKKMSHASSQTRNQTTTFRGLVPVHHDLLDADSVADFDAFIDADLQRLEERFESWITRSSLKKSIGRRR